MTPNGLHRLLETNCNDSELHYRLSEKQRALEKMGKFHIQAVDNGKVSNSTVFQQKKCAEREGKQKMKVAEVPGAIHWGVNCHSEQTTQKRSDNLYK